MADLDEGGALAEPRASASGQSIHYASPMRRAWSWDDDADKHSFLGDRRSPGTLISSDQPIDARREASEARRPFRRVSR